MMNINSFTIDIRRRTVMYTLVGQKFGYVRMGAVKKGYSVLRETRFIKYYDFMLFFKWK